MIAVSECVKEDPQRPGHVDLAFLRDQLSKKKTSSSARTLRDLVESLDMVVHDQPNAYPEFMGQYSVPEAMKGSHPQSLPKNIARCRRVPLEDRHERLEDPERGYATCKFVTLQPSLVKQDNEVAISFGDDKTAAVGSVVIRAGVID